MQKVALCEVDANRAHAVKHFGPVDKLGHGLDAHYLGDLYKTAHSGIVQRVVDQVANELAVDFYQVHIQALEVTKRRRPRTKIVQRDAHAQGAHLVNKHARIGHVGDGGGLGDL